MPAPFRISLALPEITDADRKAVLEVLSTPNVSSGPKLGEFEATISAYVGCRFAVGVNSGTSALQLGLRALGVSPGSEIILPSFAFGALLNVILEAQLTPVFIDIDERTFNPTPPMIEAAITGRTKAILAVHTFGRPVDMDAICTAAKQHALHVIEDASEALGATCAGKQAGSFGDVGIVAFYANKQITTGEGGMLLTNNEDVAEGVRRLRNQGRDSALDWCDQVEVGFSYRLAEINCALGISQLRRIESTVDRRQRIADLYDKHLAGVPGVVQPPLQEGKGRISWFAYVIQVGDENRPEFRDRVFRYLLDHGIGAGRYFPPLHLHPVYKTVADELASSTPSLPVTERVAARALALPLFNQMREVEVVQVCESLAEALESCRRSA